MHRCPACAARMQRTRNENGVYYACPACGGRSISLGILRRTMLKPYLNEIWQDTRKRQGPRRRRCNACGNRMVEITAEPETRDYPGLKIDVCPVCQMVFFDPGELERMPKLPDEVLAEAKAEEERKREKRIKRRRRRWSRLATHRSASGFGLSHARLGGYSGLGMFSTGSTSDGPDKGWKVVPALFGLPVESETSPMRGVPVVTYALMALITLFSVIAFTQGIDGAAKAWGFIPAEAMRAGGLTLLTSFFLHGNILHLLGNLYFLWTFGDNVEDEIGVGRYLVLLLAAALIGDVAHMLLNPDSTIPCIGASGGISGVIAFYALRLPKAKIGLMFRWWWHFYWLNLPAWFGFVLWILLQVGGALISRGNVAYMAHLGGALAGLGAFFIWKRADTRAAQNNGQDVVLSPEATVR